ncbi:hypothetical protein TKK_0017356 [Trichogramma kaykai]
MSVLYEYARTSAAACFKDHQLQKMQRQHQQQQQQPQQQQQQQQQQQHELQRKHSIIRDTDLPKGYNKAKRLSLGVGGALVELPLERPGWANPIEFVLSCVGYAVGIGNVWRFPFLVFRNGGGAFLIPFTIMLLAMGLPIFFLELIVGQYSRVGPTKAYARMGPIFKGLGYSTIVVISLVNIYYMVIASWTLFYTFAAFASKLSWAYCDNEFNSINCYSGLQEAECQNNLGSSYLFYNRTCVLMDNICRDFGYTSRPGNMTHCFDETASPIGSHLVRNLYERILSSEEYFNDYVLGIRGATWEHWGGLRWELLGCLTLCWIVCYFCLRKGIHSIGKVVYFTAIFPYIVLVALMIRGATLEGSLEGIMWFITPNWSSLTDAGVWADAASQVFYSLGIGCGSLVTLASYSSFGNNCHRDAIFVTLTNLLTSVFAGLVTFSVMGFLAKQMGLEVEEVVRSGTGLAFIVFPEAVVRMPLPNLWAFSFFFMLFILGLGSQFAGVQALSSAVLDFRPRYRCHESRVYLVICVLCWLLAIPMVFDGGIYLFTLMDWNSASWAVLLIGFVELTLPAWAYGCNRLIENLDEMNMRFGPFLRAYWKFSWAVLAPASALGVFAYQMYTYRMASYGDYRFPFWAEMIGILIGLSTLAPIPIGVYHRLRSAPRNWSSLLGPTASWGPAKKLQLKQVVATVYQPEQPDSDKLAVSGVANAGSVAAASNPAFSQDSQV